MRRRKEGRQPAQTGSGKFGCEREKDEGWENRLGVKRFGGFLVFFFLTFQCCWGLSPNFECARHALICSLVLGLWKGQSCWGRTDSFVQRDVSALGR